MARHQHPHEVLGFAVAVLAGHEHFVDVLVVEVAHRALDQRAFLIDEGGRGRLQRQLADIVPQPHQIFVVALDLGLGAALAGGAQDDAHALRHLEVGDDLLEALAVLRVGDLARDAAATRGVGHQHRIAAGERQIGGQRSALVAALFLDDLHEQDLAALDDFLDLVVAARRLAAVAHFLQRVLGADRLDLVVLVVVMLVAVLDGRLASRPTRAAFSEMVSSSTSAAIEVGSPSLLSFVAACFTGSRRFPRRRRISASAAASRDFVGCDRLFGAGVDNDQVALVLVSPDPAV